MSKINQYISNYEVEINVIETVERQTQVETGDCIKTELILFCRNPWGKTIQIPIYDKDLNEALISIECFDKQKFQFRVNGDFVGYFKNADEIYNFIENHIDTFFQLSV